MRRFNSGLFLIVALFLSAKSHANLVINLGSCAGLDYLVVSTFGINGAAPLIMGAALDYDGDGQIARVEIEGESYAQIFGVRPLDGEGRDVEDGEAYTTVIPMTEGIDATTSLVPGRKARFIEIATPADSDARSTYTIFEAIHAVHPERTEVETGDCLDFEETREARFNTMTPDEQRRELAIREAEELERRLSNALQMSRNRQNWLESIGSDISRIERRLSHFDREINLFKHYIRASEQELIVSFQ